MRKGKLYISILFGLCLCLFTAFFTACKEETPPAPTLESISVSGATEVFIDEFDYADYTITATYSDDSTQTETLTADNLSAEDKAKLSTVGTHALTVSYESVTCSWTVTLKNHDFAGLTFDDITTTYDGTAKTTTSNYFWCPIAFESEASEEASTNTMLLGIIPVLLIIVAVMIAVRMLGARD